jgi:hypothetical protein
MTEWIADLSTAFSVELIGQFADACGTRFDGPMHQLIHVFGMDVHGDGGAAEGLRPREVICRIFIGEHDDVAAEFDLGVPDTAGWLGEAVDFFGAKSLFIKVDGGGRIAHAQIRKDFENFDHAFSLETPCGMGIGQNLPDGEVVGTVDGDTLVFAGSDSGEGAEFAIEVRLIVESAIERDAGPFDFPFAE